MRIEYDISARICLSITMNYETSFVIGAVEMLVMCCTRNHLMRNFSENDEVISTTQLNKLQAQSVCIINYFAVLCAHCSNVCE